VKLPCHLELLAQYEEMEVAELPCPLETTEVAIVKLLCPLGMMEVVVAELLAQYDEMAVAELLVDQKKWQVHGPRVMTSVFDLSAYAASVAISAHLRKFHVSSTI
jgi:hypothetical protein